MKLIIQIPCYNEAETLPETLADLPKSLPGIDKIETMVIDDGSLDGTADVAAGLGVDHVLRNFRNRGLAYAFARGLEAALSFGADIIVNTDGDHQYRGMYIKDLVEPILAGEADMVVGDRRTETVAHFSWIKKQLQKIGSMIVRWASRTSIPDATSGFRALSRDAAQQMVIYTSYTYTLETIIQAGRKGMIVASVPVETNPLLRESRLISSIPRYVMQSAVTIVRISLMYDPLRVFLSLGILPLVGGGVLIVRFLYFYLIGEGSGHIQSLVAASILLVSGFLTFLLGFLGDLIARNRQLSEEIRYRILKKEMDNLIHTSSDPMHR